MAWSRVAVDHYFITGNRGGANRRPGGSQCFRDIADLDTIHFAWIPDEPRDELRFDVSGNVFRGPARLGSRLYERPRAYVCSLSYENFSNNSETSKKMAKAVEILHQKYPDMIVDGEIQPDFAMKGNHLNDYPFSKLGKTPANTFIFPNLESANLSYKIIRGMDVAQVVGPIMMGLDQPVHVLQMGASVDEIVNLATVAVLDAQMREQ